MTFLSLGWGNHWKASSMVQADAHDKWLLQELDTTGSASLYGPSGTAALHREVFPELPVYDLLEPFNILLNLIPSPDSSLLGLGTLPEENGFGGLTEDEMAEYDEEESFLGDLDYVSLLEETELQAGFKVELVLWQSLAHRPWYSKLKAPGLTPADMRSLILGWQIADLARTVRGEKRKFSRGKTFPLNSSVVSEVDRKLAHRRRRRMMLS